MEEITDNKASEENGLDNQSNTNNKPVGVAQSMKYLELTPDDYAGVLAYKALDKFKWIILLLTSIIIAITAYFGIKTSSFVSEKEKSITQIQNKFDSLATIQTRYLKSFKDEKDLIDKYVDNANTSINRINESASALDGRVNDIVKDYLQAYREQSQELSNAIAENNVKIGKVNEKNNEIDEKLKQIPDLTSNMTKLEGLNEEAKKYLSQLPSSINSSKVIETMTLSNGSSLLSRLTQKTIKYAGNNGLLIEGQNAAEILAEDGFELKSQKFKIGLTNVIHISISRK